MIKCIIANEWYVDSNGDDVVKENNDIAMTRFYIVKMQYEIQNLIKKLKKY